jgi:hypothetical protein
VMKQKTKRREGSVVEATLTKLFHAKVAAPDHRGCRLWTAFKNGKGYGMFMVSTERQARLAHRIAWRLAYGEIPAGLLVCHHCDVPACCEPTHLFLGTQMDNWHDSARKGRRVVLRGEQHGRAKLTSERVAYIRKSTEPAHILANRFGVCIETIRRVRRREFWRN